MNDHATTGATLLPLADIRSHEQYLTGGPDPAVDTIDVWGRCAGFCAETESVKSGTAVDQHGPECWSRVLWAKDMTGQHFEIRVVRPYFHGRYDAVAYRALGPGRHEDVGQIVLFDDDLQDRGSMSLSSGDMRRMAAAFVRAADIADGFA